jgi:hypothetical protein
MKKLIAYLTIDKTYVFAGQKDQIFQVFKNSKGIRYSLERDDEIELASFISWGTMGFPFGSIRVRMHLQNLDSDRTQVHFKTSIRPEYVVLIILLLVVLVSIPAEPLWFYPLMASIWILFLLLLRFIYRIQKIHLIDTVVAHLRLRKR